MLWAIEVAQRYQEQTRFVTALLPYHAMIANDLIVVDVVLLKEHYTIPNLLIPIIVGLTHNLLYFPFCLGSVLSIEQLSYQTKQSGFIFKRVELHTVKIRVMQCFP